MQQKTILITGSTSGIGLEGARVLGSLGWRVFVHARNEQRGLPAIESLRSRNPTGQFELVTGDLASLESVTTLADQIAKATPSLDVLWNNAGGMFAEKRLSADGIELQMAVNHLAPFVLTHRLKPLLEKAPQGRVIGTSSMAHSFAKVTEDWFGDTPGKYSGWAVYSKSKLANILFIQELARLWADTAITVQAFHPGWVRTAFGQNQTAHSNFFDLIGLRIPVEKGADTGVFLATSEAGGRNSGSYWAKRKIQKPAKTSPEQARQLWEQSLSLAQRFVK